MNEFLALVITSIGTSIVAAIIFWFFFNYWPEKSRYNKIRPKLEYDIYEIYSSLFHFIEIPLRYNMHSPAYVQAKLYAGMCSIEDFELALYSKCLNDSYKIDSIAPNLLPIGDKLDAISLDVCQKAQHLYVFNHYLTTEEVLLLRKITVKVRMYSYNSVADMKIGNRTLYHVNPTISYMSNNFHELYFISLQLQEIVLKYNKLDDKINDSVLLNLSTRRVMNHCHRGEYKECLKLAKEYDDKHVWGWKFISLYKIGKGKDAVKLLKQQLLSSDLKLISLRSTFCDFYKDETLKNILINCRSESEYIEMVNCIKSEQEYSDEMINQAQKIRNYYKEKVANHTKV